MSDLNLLWTILSIIGSVIGSVAFAAWWLKGQFTSAEHAGLREQNAALREQAKLQEGYRQWAEDRAKAVADRLKELAETEERANELEEQATELSDQLTEAKTTIATLEKQIAAGENKVVLANTTSMVQANIVKADRLATLTTEERKQLREHVAAGALAELRRLIAADAEVLKHLAKHPGIRGRLPLAHIPAP